MRRLRTELGLVAFLLLAQLASLAVLADQVSDDRLQWLLSDAKNAQTRGAFDSAAADYRRAIALRPDLAELWANLGLMEHQSGKAQEAIESFKKALSLKASLFVPNLFLGIDLLQMKKAEEAIPYLRRAQALNGGDPQVPLKLGQAYADLNDTNRASEAYRRATKLDPHNSDGWFGLGLMSLEQIEQDTRQLIHDPRGSPYLHLLAGEAFGNEGKPAESVAAYKAALAEPAIADCTFTEYGFALLRIEDVSGAKAAFGAKSASKCPLEVLGMARIELEQQSPQRAWQQINGAWKSDRQIVIANIGRAWSGLTVEKLEALKPSVMQAVSAGLIPPDLAQLQLSSLSGVDGNQPIQSQSVIQLDGPTRTPALQSTREAEYAFYAGDFWTTRECARRLAQVPATRAKGLYWEIRADQRLGVSFLSEAARTAPDSPKVHVMIGDMYRQRELYQEAEEEYKRALVLVPGEPGALLGLAADYFVENRFDDAISTDAVALKESPDDPKANLLEAEVLVARQAFTEAEPFLKRSLSGEPELLPRVHVLLGECYEAGNDLEGAIREMEIAAASDEDGSVYYKLAMLYKKIGKIAAANAAIVKSKNLHAVRIRRTAHVLEADPLTLRTEPPDR